MYVLRFNNIDNDDPMRSFCCLKDVYHYLKLLGIEEMELTPEQVQYNESAADTITVPIDDKHFYQIIHVSDRM
jgi:hypothetical protein